MAGRRGALWADGPACCRARPSYYLTRCRPARPCARRSRSAAAQQGTASRTICCRASGRRTGPRSLAFRVKGQTLAGATRIMPRAMSKLVCRARRLRSPGRAAACSSLASRSMSLLQLVQGHARGRRIQIGNRVVTGEDADSLMHGRQKVAVPHLRSAVRRVLAQHDVRRQVRVERSQPKAQPGPDAGQGHGGRAGVHRQHRLKVLDDVGVQASQHAELVGHALPSGETARTSASPIRHAAKSGTANPSGAARRFRANGSPRRSCPRRLQAGLRIERVDVREPAREEHEDQCLARAGWFDRRGASGCPP